MSATPVYKQIPVILQGLYLVNLLALPGLAMIPMIYLCHRHWHSRELLITCHVRQVVASTIWFFVVILGGIGLFWLTGNNQSPEHWTMLLMYLIVFHTTFVMVGMIGLAKALTGKTYQLYLIGAPWANDKNHQLDA